MQDEYIAQDGTRVNLVRLPRGVGRLARNIPKTRWNRVTKPHLLAEANYRNLPLSQHNLKKYIIERLMAYYQRAGQFDGSAYSPIENYRFTEPVAQAIVAYGYMGRPGIQTPEVMLPLLALLQEQARREMEDDRPLPTHFTTRPTVLTPLPPLGTQVPPVQAWARVRRIRTPTAQPTVLSPMSPMAVTPSPKPTQPILTPLPPLGTQISPVPTQPTISPLPPLGTRPILNPLAPLGTQPILSPLPPLGTQAGLPPIGQIGVGLPPLPTGITATIAPTVGFMPDQYTLDNIYNIKSTTTARTIYRQLMNNPDIGGIWSIGRLKDQIIIEAHNRGYLSKEDYNIHNSKAMRMMRDSISQDNLNRLISAYNLRDRTGFHDNKDKLALVLYHNGVGFHDLMYAASNEPNLISGDLLYKPKPNEKIEGVYEWTGKVDKDQNDLIEPVPGSPYSYLSTVMLRRIADDRDVDIQRGKHQVVFISTLSNYDQIFPDWINQALNPDLNHTRNQLYYLGGTAGINMGKMDTQNMALEELRNLVKLGRIVMVPREPLPPRKSYQQYEFQESIPIDYAYHLSNNQGYILNKSNISFPFSVFGKNKNREETLGYFAELALYPANVTTEEYQTITNQRSPSILKKLLREKYGTDDIMLLDDNHLLFIASRGYILPDAKIQETKKRYEEIKKYSNILIQKLRRLYDLTNIPRDNIDELKYAIASEDPHPLEPLIVYFKQEVIDNTKISLKQKFDISSQYSKQIGMIIPPTVERKGTYFWNNVHLYKHILTRPATIGPIDKNLLSAGVLTNKEVKHMLKRYTDQEIFQYTGVYLPYTSRNGILDNVNDIRQNMKFFIPVVRACANEDTITTFDETADINIFIIGYGTMFEYFCYNLDDFMESFREFAIEGLEGVTAFRFRKPNEPAEDFTTQEIQELVTLLENYPNMEGVPAMINRLRNGLQRVREMTDYDRQILTTFNGLPANDKPIVREWLHQLFNTGMYMRRWKGPGNPYPILRGDTQGPDPNIKVNEQLQILGYHPVIRKPDGKYPPFSVSGITTRLTKDGQKFVNDLRSIEYVRGEGDVRTPRQQTRTIGYYLDRVRKGNMCIRMASSIFVATGSYYVGVFFEEDIPGFDPAQVARIV